MEHFLGTNGVSLKVIPKGAKIVGYKWVYKTKCHSIGNVEIYKARFVTKGFTWREEIDYNKTFSPIPSENLIRIIIALVGYYNLEPHQMDIKTTFLNGELQENVCMEQPRVLL